VVSALLLLKALGNCAHAHRSVLAAPAPWAGAMPASACAFLAATHLHDPATGAVSHATDLPWEDAVVAGTRRLLRATLLVRVPTAAAACVLAFSARAWAWALRVGYQPIFTAVLLADAAFFVYTDWLIADVTGGLVVEWPSKLMALRALGLCAALLSGPFSEGWNRLGWLVRCTFCGATLAAHARLRGRLWHSAGYRITIAVMLAEAAAERANQRRLRRKYAAHVAASGAAQARKKAA
jgi:hypothetical protein